MNKYIIYGYALSVVAAIPVTEAWSHLLHRAVKKIPRDPEDREASRVPWIPRTVGMFERAIITTLIGWNVSGAAGFIGAWIAIKSAGGWQNWSRGSTYGRATLFVGLLGSALSILFALLGGLMIVAARAPSK